MDLIGQRTGMPGFASRRETAHRQVLRGVGPPNVLYECRACRRVPPLQRTAISHRAPMLQGQRALMRACARAVRKGFTLSRTPHSQRPQSAPDSDGAAGTARKAHDRHKSAPKIDYFQVRFGVLLRQVSF